MVTTAAFIFGVVVGAVLVITFIGAKDEEDYFDGACDDIQKHDVC